MSLAPSTSPELKTLIATAKAKQALPNALNDDAHVIQTLTKPTLLVFWGDWHFGAQGMAYDQFEIDLSALQTAKHVLGEQIQVIGMGDYIDGYLPTGTPKNPTQLLSPGEQRQAAQEALKAVQPLVIIEGDHDMWHSKQDLEYNWLHEFAMREGFNYAQWGMKLELVLPGAKSFTCLIRHRYKGSKASDNLKPQRNLHLNLGPADLVALGHFHSSPGVYKTHALRRHEGVFLSVQSGTYKLSDDYGKKLGYVQADYGVPAVLVYPDGKVESFDDFNEGVNRLL